MDEKCNENNMAEMKICPEKVLTNMKSYDRKSLLNSQIEF